MPKGAPASYETLCQPPTVTRLAPTGAACYGEAMPTVQEKLETLIAKVRSLPEARQEAAVEALEEITEEPYQLSGEELAVLKLALEEARHDDNLTDAEADELLNKPWA